MTPHWAKMAAIGRARWRPFDAALGARLVAALAAGGDRLEVVLAADPELPCKPVVARWRREAPGFDAAVRAALGAQQQRRLARTATPPGPGAIRAGAAALRIRAA